MDSIIELVAGSLSNDPSILASTQKKIEVLSEQNFADFITKIVEVHLNPNNAPGIIQAAALIFKNAVTATDPAICAKKNAQWISLSAEVKSKIKESLLANLGSSTGNFTPPTILAIATIELPRSEWAEVIEKLLILLTTQNSPELLRINVITTISYICESIPPTVLVYFSDHILNTVVNGAQSEETPQVRKRSLDALFHALLFVKTNFEREHERTAIMTVLCDAAMFGVKARARDMSKYAKSPDESDTDDEDGDSVPSLCHSAMQCLIRVVEVYYAYIPAYMNTLLTVALYAISCADDTHVLLGLEFLSTLFEKEFNILAANTEAADLNLPTANMIKCHQISFNVAQQVIPYLFGVMCTQRRSADEDDWYPAMAASTCLTLLSQAIGPHIVQLIAPFVSSSYTSENWHLRDASLMAIGCVIEGLSGSTLVTFVASLLPLLNIRVDDPFPTIRDTVAWVFGRICELCLSDLDAQVHCNILDSLLKLLQGAMSAQRPQLAATCCWALLNFADKISYCLKSNDAADSVGGGSSNHGVPVLNDSSNEILPSGGALDKYSYFPSVYPRVLSVLVELCNANSDHPNLRVSVYETLAAWISLMPQSCESTVRVLASNVHERISALLRDDGSAGANSAAPQDTNSLPLLYSLLGSSIRALEKEIASNPGPIVALLSLHCQLVKQVVALRVSDPTGHLTLTSGMLQALASSEDMLLCLSSLILVLGEKFADCCNTFTPLVLDAIGACDEAALMSAGLGVVADMCKALGEKFTPHVPAFMGSLGSAVMAPNVPIAAKPLILTCFGDIAVAVGSKPMIGFVGAMINVLQQASNVVSVGHGDQEYIEQLREAVLESLASIVNTFCSPAPLGSPESLQAHLPAVISILRQGYYGLAAATASSTAQPDRLIANIAGAVGDLLGGFTVTVIAPLLKEEDSWLPSFLATACNGPSLSTNTQATARWATSRCLKLNVFDNKHNEQLRTAASSSSISVAQGS